MLTYRKKFISLDLETTHLDMREGRIMEIGAVEVELVFSSKEKKLKVNFGKSFTSLVNPEIQPSLTALMLTRIPEQELQGAPLWREVKDKIQKFLADEILLGHNLWFDFEYLKNQGLKLNNSYVDTLEIAQTILPLIDAHSLEYLVTEFEVSREPSHRALIDAQNSALILAEVLSEFLRFPKDLQAEARDFLQKSKLSFRDLILDLPTTTLPKPPPARSAGSPRAVQAGRDGDYAFDWPDKTLVSLPLGFAEQEQWLLGLSQESKSGLVGVPRQIFLDFLRSGQKLASPLWALCDKRLSWILSWDRQAAPDPVYKILIKIAIFRHFAESFDLSLVKWSPLERQYLSGFLVDPEVCLKHSCGYVKSLDLKKNQTYFLELQALFSLVWSWKRDFGKQSLVLFDLAAIEDGFGEVVKKTWNLKKIRAGLEFLYPLEAGFFSWHQNLPRQVQEVGNELDLFFGILHLIYRRAEGEFSETVLIDEAEEASERLNKLLHPAEKLLTKLKAFRVYLGNQIALTSSSGEEQIELAALAGKIESLGLFVQDFFFERSTLHDYWLRFDSKQVDLESAPRDLRNPWREVTQKFFSTTLVDTQLPQLALQYYERRLGIENFQVQKLPALAEPVKINILSKPVAQKLLREFFQRFEGSTIAVLPNENKLKEVYQELLQNPKEGREVLAYKFSGSLHSLKRKLVNLRGSFILLLTTNALLRFFPVLPPANNLVILRLPFEAPGTGPAFLRGGGGGERDNSFANYTLPRAIHVLHTMLSRFLRSREKLREVFILDTRIATDYDQRFMEYLSEFPNFQLSTIT